MTPAARLTAAIGLLDAVLNAKRPLSLALNEWGKANRYAGSGDRSAIGTLVHDALRVKATAAWMMGEREEAETSDARAILLASLRLARGMDVAAIAGLCSGERFAPPPLSEAEHAALGAANLTDAPPHILGNYPAWLDDAFTASFGETRIAELAAMAARAPLDLRVNALKLLRLKALEALGHLDPAPTPHSPYGLRILENAAGRVPYVQAEPAFLKGAVEVQDEGSQLVSLLAAAKPGMQVLDLCAGGGGKTLALAAEMNNKGQIFATDSDQRRLAPIHERITRAGVHNVQVRTPKAKAFSSKVESGLREENASKIKVIMPLDDLIDKMDLVLVDAPCTGTGTWRRHPDAKWRMRPNALDLRISEQKEVLENAARFVKPGGRLVYITCSLLDSENGGQIKDFITRHPQFAPVDPAENARLCGLAELGQHRDPRGLGLLLTPHRTGTDGFFVSCLTFDR